MPRSQPTTIGGQFAERLSRAQRKLSRAPRSGARNLPVLVGLSPDGSSSTPIENQFALATQFLLETEKFYLYDGEIMIEQRIVDEQILRPLTMDSRVEPGAVEMVANHFTCQTSVADDKQPKHFAPPSKFFKTMLAREPTRAAFRPISCYARRPVYDSQFVLRGPGYHPEPQYLVHADEIEPVLPSASNSHLPVRERLLPCLRELLAEFCFAEDADITNAVSILLTGFLSNHFVTPGKPVVLLDGNQPGVGKTLLGRTVGVVLDGFDPDLINYSRDDEELAKRFCATLRKRPTSVLIVDNAKTPAGANISSPVIEANSVAPRITLRVLGHSLNYTRPNDVLWLLTMNQTQVSPDLVSRGLPIRFRYEGNPRLREFTGQFPVEYALQRRAEILAELAGMIEWWKQLGRPLSTRRHRCKLWAQVVGGILEANGFQDFLANLDAASAEFNAEHGELAALAEWSVQHRVANAFIVTNVSP